MKWFTEIFNAKASVTLAPTAGWMDPRCRCRIILQWAKVIYKSGPNPVLIDSAVAAPTESCLSLVATCLVGMMQRRVVTMSMSQHSWVDSMNRWRWRWKGYGDNMFNNDRLLSTFQNSFVIHHPKRTDTRSSLILPSAERLTAI